MPGILPMKVIKLGTSAQSRIAQACDRCRSKKIRCDGVTPCCTQCANVGFECKTSDKLSRRAFPRGYTESLEERVRSLEQEVRELKDLLDEKDEKIDILSRIHSASPVSGPPSDDRAEQTSQTDVKLTFQPETSREDVFRVQASPSLLATEADSYCTHSRLKLSKVESSAQTSGPRTSLRLVMHLTLHRPKNPRQRRNSRMSQLVSSPIKWSTSSSKSGPLCSRFCTALRFSSCILNIFPTLTICMTSIPLHSLTWSLVLEHSLQ
ncbi:MAG: hypothetical protein Q9183_005046, partial [Haloplaca sp. 2 TL-2023]